MRLSHFFIDRPRFAIVLSIFITLLGLGALAVLPVAQYPEVVPPTVQITASLPGAPADTVARTVATPLEQEINGVENMLYMSSQSTGDGNLTITVTFRIGTDLNVAQMLTQNRVQDALPRLPEDVQRLGVQVRKATPSILLAVHLFSPDRSRDTLYLSNYLTLHVKDELARLQGVGDVQFQGGREYAMRIWLDPDKVAAHDLSAAQVLDALRAQNLQVAAGVLNRPPVPAGAAYQIGVEARGRLSTPEEFGDIVIKSDGAGRVTRVRDVGRVEVGAADYGSSAFVDHYYGLPLLIFAEPGANSLAVDKEVVSKMRELSKVFPPGVAYTIVYDPTIFISKSIHEVIVTIFVAILLVVGVVFVFLQTWRATIVPVIAIPVSLLGAFAVLLLLGISINNLSLFGLVLAVGIVVDDAIVVVENVERNLELGMSPSAAAHRTMDEVGGALISIALTLCAVFVPSAFLSGITGLFFRQFAVTIAASTVISCFVSLTLSPALCAILLKAHGADAPRGTIGNVISSAFGVFNRGFESLSASYGRLTGRLVRTLGVVLIVYVGLIGISAFEFARTPTGFIPEQDQGYLITIIQLPPGASLSRTEAVVRQANDIILSTKGVEHDAPFVGLDATTSTDAPNTATIFSGLPSLYNHELKGVTAETVLADLRRRLSVIKDAYVLTIPPPPVQGLGNSGGFKLMLEDRAGLGPQALVGAAKALVAAANKDPDFAGVFTLFNAASPSTFADIDREKAEKLNLDSDRYLLHASGLSRLPIRQRLQLSRPHLRGHCAGRWTISAHAGRSGQSQGSQFSRADGADRQRCAAETHDDPLPGSALRSISRSRGPRRRRSGCRIRNGLAAHGRIGAPNSSKRHRLRVDRARVSAGRTGDANLVGVCRRRTVRFFGSGCAIRKLEVASHRRPHRADVSPRVGHGTSLARTADRYSGADRVCGFGRPSRQKCDPDRRVRPPKRT